MKICKPKYFLVLLVLIFLIFNSIFFINKLLTDNLQEREKVSIYSKTKLVEFLKTYVDFNHTAFTIQDQVHFYYPVIIKNDFNDLNFQNKNNSKIYDKIKISNCSFFYDFQANKFLDSNNLICKEDNFDFNSKCCKVKEKESFETNNSINATHSSQFNLNNTLAEYPNCDNKINCCKYKSSCMNICISETSKNYTSDNSEIFNECKFRCNLNYISINQMYPYCFADLSNTKEKVTIHISNEVESCKKTCENKSLKCYNHLLYLYNNCDIIEGCHNCSLANYYGPGFKMYNPKLGLYSIVKNLNLTSESSSKLCFYSHKLKLSCEFENASINRICPCI